MSVEGVRKSVEKCVGVWRDVRKGIEAVMGFKILRTGSLLYRTY